MVCIYCGQQTHITNSRPQRRQAGTWRRHHCQACGAIFTSLERADYSSSLSFQNSSASHIVPFDRDSLFISIYEACKHRPSAAQDASALTDTVISRLLRSSQRRVGLVERAQLITLVATTLKTFDHAAHVSYLAYHLV